MHHAAARTVDPSEGQLLEQLLMQQGESAPDTSIATSVGARRSRSIDRIS